MIGGWWRRPEEPEWAGEIPTGRRWEAVRNPALAATRRQRKATLILAAVLTAMPTGAAGLLMSVNALNQASAAVVAAEEALAAVQNRERVESARHTVAAVAAVQRRLAATGSPYADGVLVPDLFALTDLDGEQHTVGVVAGGERVLTALVDVVGQGASSVVGVIFTPTGATPSSPEREAGPLLGECTSPYIVEDEAATPQDGQRELALRTDVSIAAVFPTLSTGETLEPAKLEQFLAAWTQDDQQALRELGNFTSADPRGWFGVLGWRYMPGTARVVSVVLTSRSDPIQYLAHVQFAMCGGAAGGVLVQDMGVQGQRDGELTRVLLGGPLGVPQAS